MKKLILTQVAICSGILMASLSTRGDTLVNGFDNPSDYVLNGIIGRKAGSYPDFGYSPQNKNFAVRWDATSLTRFLKSPKSYLVGTKMFFDGLSAPKDIADVIAFLGQFDIDGKKKQ